MSEPGGAGERRASERRRCRLSSCRLLLGEAGRQTWPAEVRDISARGVGLVCGSPLEPGMLLPLELTCPELRLAIALEARVVHVAVLPGGRWLAGCAFAGRLLDPLLARFQ